MKSWILGINVVVLMIYPPAKILKVKKFREKMHNLKIYNKIAENLSLAKKIATPHWSVRDGSGAVL